VWRYTPILLILIILLGCSDKKELANEGIESAVISADSNTANPAQIETPQPEADDKALWNHYVNARFGYSIDYPTEWTASEESSNGDGKVLYVGNPDVDIRVYGSHYIEGVSGGNSDHLQTQWITLDNGVEAGLAVGYEEEKYVMHLTHLSESDVEYQFYAKVSKDFFEANEKTLLRVAKSLNFLEAE